jgi:hypothetical protein
MASFSNYLWKQWIKYFCEDGNGCPLTNHDEELSGNLVATGEQAIPRLGKECLSGLIWVSGAISD